MSSFKGEGFLGTKLLRKGKLYYVVNFYSSYSINLKRKLWKDLLTYKSKCSDGEWCLSGDFNAIVNERERQGSDFFFCRKTEIRDFASFISATSLIDVYCKGKAYSWYNEDVKSISRIDMFFLSNSLIVDWGNVGKCIDKRDIFDHCPIWLIID